MTLQEMKDRSEFGKFLELNGYKGTGVEVGVFKGEFSKQILDDWRGSRLIGVDAYNNGTNFHLLWAAINLNMEYVEWGSYIIIVCKSSEAHKHTPSELDFVYIDADHSFSAVREDIKNWYPKIRSGGILCGHDYAEGESGVRFAVDEFLGSNPHLSMTHKPCNSWFIIKP